MKIDQMLDMSQVTKVLKLLSDKTRLTIVKLLENQSFCVCEFVEIFSMSQPSISQHLRKLRDAGLIQEERKGQWMFYSLNKESESYDFLLSILEKLPSQEEKFIELEKKGTRINCC
ncbi:ArsR family transcriptional regulator [Gracilibacillus halophilus YIM-C55.5]|uniref:ArsR family transcriptional regulator n=1 Tax=Gracilibacillus halophilus YIM-C55.5 TaxID=1308866 RepID=N4WM40_9BACI|nr:metalloregulator ArsR/SmtB family transcription factor [Gracilibacillus halophilus]ENH97237.1 ArsR family transcriptional regulator [Gracilibacillus halophilus YIM-C55.5]